MPDHRCGYVAIIGRPNVGKSTLMNRLLGQKLAITAHKPQTTRHNLLGIKTLEQGQILYVDTPGRHQRGDSALNRYLNRAAESMVQDVDLVVFVIEALRWTAEDQAVLDNLAQAGAKVVLAINKIDRLEDKTRLLPFLNDMGERYDFAALVPISAQKGKNLQALQAVVLEHLPLGEAVFPEDQITDRPERFFAAELVREQLTRRYGEELPYAVSVEIEHFEEVGQLYRISALIWVERPGQKKIIIGQDGAALKEVATLARLEMERMFEHRVFLSLWVKVKKSWSSDEASLSRLGYRL